ncbi:MAG: DUF4492 domain-containing protein [Muribaculaceae bacterium]|nr:DUF4492 domain-containing protein [Muribaculaceae bacterium]MDE6871488.1 DUF4492 domain-containing protein [Bacteroidales bacterium]
MLCIGEKLKSIWHFYADGFRNMTWGRSLWVLIILKLFFLFAVLRLFFFRPVLSGKSDGEKSDFVGTSLIERTEQVIDGK